MPTCTEPSDIVKLLKFFLTNKIMEEKIVKAKN